VFFFYVFTRGLFFKPRGVVPSDEKYHKYPFSHFAGLGLFRPWEEVYKAFTSLLRTYTPAI
jgi:hypothetical protein